MDVVGLGVLEKFKQRHADVRGHVDAWMHEVESASWDTPHAITERYPSASVLSDQRVVFNLKGNTYRLLVRVAYNTGKVIVLKAGTHAEYDRWEL